MTQLPNCWEYESINSIVQGGMIADGDWVESKDQDPNGQVRLTQLADVGDGEFRSRSDRWMNEEQASRLNVNYLQPGDLLMARMPDPLGRTCMVPENIGRAVTVVDVAIIRITRKDVNPKFVMWLLNSPGIRQQIEMLASGTTRRRITRKNLGTIDLPMPPFEEQNKIVELLEDHISCLDAALADVKQAKIKAVQFRRSLLQAAFMGNVGSDVNSRATKWKTKTVGEIADTQLGKMLNKGRQSGKHAKPYLRTDNVHWGRFDLSEIKEMDILPEELGKYLATKGDLLMCEGGASGRTAIWNEDYDISFQNHVHRIRPKNSEEISPKYLLYYFEWFIKNGFASDLIKGVTISSLSQSGLRSIEVTYPLIEEQLEIVGLLEDHLSRLDASVSLADAMEKQSNGLRRSLFNAAFTGQLTKEVVSV
jgi:type I restriction enzyme S subunit